ncbi:cell elongation-specific peptidoglycan D,D-transpeptidase [Paraoerskovia marina]|uniref:Cell elongation-specific peptidoglycan D,D-transpeptidase n=1 Tax=Paraoerskovia marina TaxID=545619 RepID=A0A1H1N7Q1_9CELL|nr:penicillin-binding transpeptidase domain-containing protein [Paraoerskovia marina]SDR95043.1 cell elongation-specific peptidoglycan D,D-transpeptidase [Paraoerskovia marina]
MNVPIRRVATIALLMVLALMVSTTIIQVFRAPDISADPRNKRTIYEQYGRARGPIVVEGDSIAKSEPVDDPYQYQREYTDGELYAPVTGFYSLVNGSTGIEAAEDDYLSGTADDLWFTRIKDLLTGNTPQGSSVELTLNAAAQQAAWDGLGDQVGAVVAIEPATGKILAMVSKPSYDPNVLADHDLGAASDSYSALVDDDTDPLINRAIAGDTYPPGSTFKLVTSAAALESGDYEPDTVIPAPDVYQYPNSTAVLPNFGGEQCDPSGEQTLAEALEISCNTAFAELAVAIGEDALREQAEAFGYDTDLSIPMTVTPSRFPATDDLDEAGLARAGIGQGDVFATPLEIAMTSAAIANGGEQMQPYLVDTVRSPDLDVVSQTAPQTLRQSVSSETASELTEMMLGVVEDGTGTAAQISGVEVAGKSGTAQHGDGTENPHAWFTAFAPADNPQVAVAVIVEDGGSQGSEATGGSVSAPIASAVIQAVLG